jgi:hypothetical protein
MHLTDLTDDELMVLLGALKMVTWADGELSEAESDTLGQIMSKVGPRATVALRRAREEITGQAALAAWAQKVQRVEARVVIFDACTLLARSDGIDDREMGVLDWLDDVWQAG